MRLMQWSTGCFVCVFVVSGALSGALADQVDPSGTYTWERTRRNSDEKVKNTLTLKADGTRLTGTLARGRGEPSAIENGKIDGDAISFEITRVRGDRRFTLSYQGKVTATGLTLTTRFGRGDQARSRTWEAAKVRGAIDVVGLWKFKVDRPDGGEPIATSLKISKDGDQLKGLYTGPYREIQARKIMVEGDVLSFELSGTADNVGEFRVVYKGKISGNAVKGQLTYQFGDRDGTMNFVGQREGKKSELKVAQVLGTWNLAVVRQNGDTRESKLSLSQVDGKLKGVFSSPRGELEAKKVELKGDTLLFELSVETDNGEFHASYKGKVSGSSLKGTMSFRFGDREGTRDFSGTLEKKKVSL